MASVPLSFIPPARSDLATLHIFESDNPNTGFIEIQSTPVGTYPDYITRFTTTAANNVNDWFAIQWESTTGVLSDLSAPIKGGTTTLVGEIVDRVLLRLPGANENIVLQEAEATIEFIYNVDPYSIDPATVDRLWLTELTNLVVVAVQYVDIAVSALASGDTYTAGMLSQSASSKTSSSTAIQTLERLERRSLKRLGIGGSLIAAIQEQIDCGWFASGYRTVFDSSRVLSTRAIITEHIVTEDLETGVISDR